MSRHEASRHEASPPAAHRSPHPAATRAHLRHDPGRRPFRSRAGTAARGPRRHRGAGTALAGLERLGQPFRAPHARTHRPRARHRLADGLAAAGGHRQPARPGQRCRLPRPAAGPGLVRGAGRPGRLHRQEGALPRGGGGRGTQGTAGRSARGAGSRRPAGSGILGAQGAGGGSGPPASSARGLGRRHGTSRGAHGGTRGAQPAAPAHRRPAGGLEAR
ncbi:hypothetical protein BH20CHL6_BH20CHL6_17020 [soil metagenome]